MCCCARRVSQGLGRETTIHTQVSSSNAQGQTTRGVLSMACQHGCGHLMPRCARLLTPKTCPAPAQPEGAIRLLPEQWTHLQQPHDAGSSGCSEHGHEGQKGPGLCFGPESQMSVQPALRPSCTHHPATAVGGKHVNGAIKLCCKCVSQSYQAPVFDNVP